MGDNAKIMWNVTIKVNNQNGQLKIRSEAGFPIKGSKTPLNSSK